MTKIGENYHAIFKNPTNPGGVCGICVSKNTTQNSIFFENPTPRGGILKYHESDPTRGEISGLPRGGANSGAPDRGPGPGPRSGPIFGPGLKFFSEKMAEIQFFHLQMVKNH